MQRYAGGTQKKKNTRFVLDVNINNRAAIICLLEDLTVSCGEHEHLLVSDMLRHAVPVCGQSVCLLHSKAQILSHNFVCLPLVCVQHVFSFVC